MKTDLPPRRLRRKHQFADGIEDNLELRVIFVFEISELTREIGIGEKHLAQAHKRAHDGDVNLHGTRTPQDAREHRDTLLGKGERRQAAAAPNLVSHFVIPRQTNLRYQSGTSSSSTL